MPDAHQLNRVMKIAKRLSPNVTTSKVAEVVEDISSLEEPNHTRVSAVLAKRLNMKPEVAYTLLKRNHDSDRIIKEIVAAVIANQDTGEFEV